MPRRHEVTREAVFRRWLMPRRHHIAPEAAFRRWLMPRGNRNAPQLVFLLAVLLVGCSAPTTQPAATPPSASDEHANHQDPVAADVRAELTERFGMTFASAGPHHLVGTAPDGVQLDLVGIPVVQVVLSLPGHDTAAVRDAAEPYLPYLSRLLGVGSGGVGEQQSIGRDLLLESLASWDASTPLDRQRSDGGLTARVTSSDDPPYVVLSVHR
jgi:hypothetical protein